MGGWGGGAELMTERLATFSEKYEFEDEFTESLWMQDMMHFCLVRGWVLWGGGRGGTAG